MAGRAEIASATIASTAPRVVELAAPEVTPNPTHGGSTISFILAGSGTAEVSVFDLGGRAVRTLASASFSAGRHTLAWDGRTATGERALPGVYFCEIRTDHVVSVKRIVLVP